MKNLSEKRERAAIEALKAFAGPDEDCVAVFFGPGLGAEYPPRKVLFARDRETEVSMAARMASALLRAAFDQLAAPAPEPGDSADECQAKAEGRSAGFAAFMAAELGMELATAGWPISTPQVPLVYGLLLGLREIAPTPLIADWLAATADLVRIHGRDDPAEPEIVARKQAAWENLEAAAAAFVKEASRNRDLYGAPPEGRA